MNLKFSDVFCPFCDAEPGFNCKNLVKFRNKETGEMKYEFREVEFHKARKNARAMAFMRQQSTKLFGRTA